MFGSAFLLGLFVKRAGISTSIGYLLAGLIIGLFIHIPKGFQDILLFFSEMSILLLFFEIGFEIHIDNIGKITGFPLYISILELILALSMSIGLLGLFGLSLTEILVYGLMAAFSSTVFTYRLLEEKPVTRGEVRETVLMVAAVEDIIIVISLSLLSGGASNIFYKLIYIVSLIAVLIILSLEFVKYFLSRIITFDENGLILLLSYGLFMGAFTGYLGFSTALGGFIAGLTSSHIEGSERLIEKLKPIRFVFIALFLISMGLNIFIERVGYVEYFWAIIIGVLIAIVHLIATVSATITAGGLGVKYGLETGFYLSTVSELTLVIAYYAMIYTSLPSTLILSASTGIIAGSIIASYMVFRKNYIIPRLLRLISYKRITVFDELMLKLRRIEGSRYKMVNTLFKRTIHIIGGLILLTIILGASIKFLIEHAFINSYVILGIILTTYIILYVVLYSKGRNTLHNLLLSIESMRRRRVLLKIIDRIYLSLVITLSLIVSLLILYFEYQEVFEYLSAYIDPQFIVFLTLFILPLIETIFIIYEMSTARIE